METEWCASKAACNEKKYQLTFDEALEVFDDPFYIEKYDEVQSSCNEERYIVLGRVKRQVVVVVVHTPRNGKSRIISARYATPKERQVYYDNIR